MIPLTVENARMLLKDSPIKISVSFSGDEFRIQYPVPEEFYYPEEGYFSSIKEAKEFMHERFPKVNHTSPQILKHYRDKRAYSKSGI